MIPDDLKRLVDLIIGSTSMGPNFDDAAEEVMRDSTNLASSAVSWAAERACDLEMNPMVTLMALKYLVQINIDLQSEEIWENLSKQHPTVKKEVHDATIENMEKQIKAVLMTAKTRKITIR